MKPIDVPINELVLDARLQMRVTLDFAAIDEYAEHLDDLPPCKAVREGEIIWVTSGWHRVHSAKKKGRATIPCFVREGTFLDALAEAAGENHDHGIRRSDADKRRAVSALLAHQVWMDRSDRLIAETCHVSHPFVAKVRAEIVEEPSGGNVSTSPEKQPASQVRARAPETESTQTQEPKRVGKDGKSYSAGTPVQVLCSGCQRKQRVGQPIVNGCINCKEAREREKKKAKKPAQAKAESEGDELPKSVRNALADTWHADCARTLSAFRQQCKGAFSWSSWLDASILDHLKAAEECFLAAIPRKVCPECKGHKSINKVPCQNCRHGGYMAGQA